ncbi:ferric reductase-like transmembrane domain-containing protein [Solirubrobacter soli]|uniref:ferric reductase-like transmembrane domain-containing protein n=1 Tax=Solirubrobacter soli TaxID=363832 RepID=UPI000423DB7D|nr:ferric reductase-like transmembrane domain-containing protein [Solirubrobacter soli]
MSGSLWAGPRPVEPRGVGEDDAAGRDRPRAATPRATPPRAATARDTAPRAATPRPTPRRATTAPAAVALPAGAHVGAPRLTRVRRVRRRLPARPRPLVVDALAALAGLGLGITLALGVSAESAGSLRADGGIATAAGRLTGLAAAYGMIVVVVLVARCGPLERAVGQDRLVRWHRRLGPWPLYLLTAHAALITVGYAQAAHDGVLHQFGQLVWTYPGILAATVASALLIAAGVTSYRLARRRMAHETWWAVHLYTYLALFLAFSHQVDTGASFVGHPWAKTWWTALWISTLALVVAYRIVLPVWRSIRHRVTVESVEPEGPDTYSVTLRGRRLHLLPVAGGQFLQWRFLRWGLWWQAHPYSLSAAPTGSRLRITVKNLGDHSAALAAMAPGTRVAIEGPYGAFTADRRTNDRVLLVGAGVGITPIRALLEELPETADVVVILRGSRREDLVLRDEIAALVAHRGGRLLELVGPRERVRLDAAIDSNARGRDVYVCGPDGFTAAVVATATDAGVTPDRIHYESFTV